MTLFSSHDSLVLIKIPTKSRAKTELKQREDLNKRPLDHFDYGPLLSPQIILSHLRHRTIYYLYLYQLQLTAHKFRTRNRAPYVVYQLQ